MNRRSNALAYCLEKRARALATLVSALTDVEWQTRVPKDGRKIGDSVLHVAHMYGLEIPLAQMIARGIQIEGVPGDVVNDMNAGHAEGNDAVTGEENHAVTKEATLDLLRRNSAAAAAAIRALSDDQLDNGARGRRANQPVRSAL